MFSSTISPSLEIDIEMICCSVEIPISDAIDIGHAKENAIILMSIKLAILFMGIFRYHMLKVYVFFYKSISPTVYTTLNKGGNCEKTRWQKF